MATSASGDASVASVKKPYRFGRVDPPELQDVYDQYREAEVDMYKASDVLREKSAALRQAYKVLDVTAWKATRGHFRVGTMEYYFGSDGLQGHS